MHSLHGRTADVKSISYDLPDDVFGEGEVKPTRPKKKAPTKKRVHETGDIEVMFLPLCTTRRKNQATPRTDIKLTYDAAGGMSLTDPYSISSREPLKMGILRSGRSPMEQFQHLSGQPS